MGILDRVLFGGRHPDPGAPPGTIRRFEVGATGLPGAVGLTSSHGVSVAEAIELARVLGTPPGRATGFGIEGGRFDVGAGSGDDVESAVDEVVRRVHGALAGGVAVRHPRR